MADQRELDINKDGVITSGRFAGQHVSSLAQYTESLERELTSDSRAQPQTGDARQADAPQPASPQERLAAHSGTRLASVSDAASQRLELDDEAEFSSQLGELGVDYTKEWKAKVDQVKQGMNDQMRVSKGVHKMIYTQLKTQEPDTFAKLHGTGQAEAVPTEEAEEEETVTAAEVQEEIKAAEPVKVSPKPVTPGSVSPTPAARTTQKKKEAKVPLQATNKVERLASEWGMTTEEYLKRVHTRGVTQDDIDRESVTRAERPGRIKSVFDRSTATS
jgi:hypothetical protein